MEAAYLKSWDVYADAVYDLVLDEEALAEVYAETQPRDRDGRRSSDASTKARAALVRVDHDYTIDVVDEYDAPSSSTST